MPVRPLPFGRQVGAELHLPAAGALTQVSEQRKARDSIPNSYLTDLSADVKPSCRQLTGRSAGGRGAGMLEKVTDKNQQGNHSKRRGKSQSHNSTCVCCSTAVCATGVKASLHTFCIRKG